MLECMQAESLRYNDIRVVLCDLGDEPWRSELVVMSDLAAMDILEARVLLAAFPDGLTPVQVRHAYGFDQVTYAARHGRVIAADGRGQTIAIVVAFHTPKISSDLRVFDQKFGLPDTDLAGKNILTQVTLKDSLGRYPGSNAGWAGEASLDVEWAHAIAPRAHILLVEAASDSVDDLLTAVDYARRQTGVVAVSMSWGAGEFPYQTDYDVYLTTPKRHVGGGGQRGSVTFISSSGDSSAGASWPATSPNVVAIGGTTLTLNRHATWLDESAWTGSGGGPSLYEGTNAPDVAYDADPNTGFSVYDTTQNEGWYTVGGTSAGAPQWAALIAIVDQGRSLRLLPSLDGPSQTLDAIYQVPATDYHDITTGSNGYPATPGYDLVTGRGTPIAQKLIPDMVPFGTKSFAKVMARAAAVAMMVRAPAGAVFAMGVRKGSDSLFSDVPV